MSLNHVVTSLRVNKSIVKDMHFRQALGLLYTKNSLVTFLYYFYKLGKFDSKNFSLKMVSWFLMVITLLFKENSVQRTCLEYVFCSKRRAPS
ncbi:hypothetical protein HanXRQr2_Chr14g0622841 [Helianthus annuus]|uniref:Uncharacterized protein n=1 Tax=Helianthus annuus TaxID=4232 RepID=A0A9K3E5U4_HELAN|nr:hypothetical protein HanXRQr2_Chr14g0622841 [Helianthus annuus]